MYLVGLLVVAPFWGFFSPKLFLNSWLSFLGIIGCFIGLFRRNISFGLFLARLFTSVTELLFSSLLLFAGFYFFYFLLPFGRSDSEVLLYWLFTTIQMGLIVPTLSKRVDEIWERSAVSDRGGTLQSQ